MNRIAREGLDRGRNVPTGSQHRRGRSLTGISGDRDENLDLFSRNRRILSVTSNDESDVLMKLGRVSVGSVKLPKTGMDDLLASTDGGKHDYDWLLTPPGTPLFSSFDANEPPPIASRSSSSVRSSASTTTKASRLSVTHSENSHSTRPTRSSSVTRPSIFSTHYTHSSNRTSVLNTSSASITSSRPSTPTSRSTLMSSARSSGPTAWSMPVRSSTPSRTRPSISSSSGNKTRPAQNPQPSTPTSRPQIPANLNSPASSRTQIPANLNSPATKSISRPSTPIRRNPTPSLILPAGRSSSVGRVPPVNGRSSAPASRANSPGPRARAPPQPIVLPDFSLDAPPNLRTTLPDRPVSAGRSRPGVTVTGRANSETAGPVNPPRRQSSSPVVTRGRLPDLSGRARLHSNGLDVSPPEIQKPLVYDAAVRRLVKPATPTESTGFGRTISKKSLDMALRHMDIRHSMGNIRAVTGTSLFPQSIRSSTAKGHTARFSDTQSPINSNGFKSENANGINQSPYQETNNEDKRLSAKFSEIDPYGSSRYDAILLKEDSKNTNWLHSLDDKSDQSPVFDHRFEALPEPFGLL